MKNIPFLSIGVYTVLAALTPAHAQEAPAVPAAMKPLMDRMVHHTQGWGVLGVGTAAHAPGIEPEPLKIGDQTYTHGLGSHAPSEIVFLLDGQFLTFDVECGVHLQQYDAGTVTFKIFVDDQEVFDSGVMRQTNPARKASVSVKDASELRLVAENAGDGITCDMANWVNPVLTPNPEASQQAKTLAVDVAPFACVAAWNPARVEGTQANRLEPIPEADLFMRTELEPNAEGLYEAMV